MQPQMVAFGGGKGGTGKSLLLVQFGLLLARQGQRVVMVDADLHGANLHSFFGLEDPEVTLESVLREEHSVARGVLPTGTPGLGLIPGVQEQMIEPTPNAEDARRLLERTCQLDADVVLWDVGSGTSSWSTALFEWVDAGVLVMRPEPTCVEREYRFLREVCRWRVGELEPQELPPARGWLPVPWLSSLKSMDYERAKTLQQCLRRAPLLVIVNHARSAQERALGDEWFAVCRRFFGVRGEMLGTLDYDERLWLSVLQRRPIVSEYPDSRWVESLQDMTGRLMWWLTQSTTLQESAGIPVQEGEL